MKQAIKYFEDAIRETDETLSDCSKALQAELTEQKKHFLIALTALREKDAREHPLLLTLAQLRECENQYLWVSFDDEDSMPVQIGSYIESTDVIEYFTIGNEMTCFVSGTAIRNGKKKFYKQKPPEATP